MEKRVEFHVLGPLRVVVDGVEVPIAARRQRALLVLLAINAGRVVPAERLIDQLWDGTPPPQGAVTLRSYVSNVRQALGGQSGFGSLLVTRGPGYCLDVPGECVDAMRLSTAAEEGRERLRQNRPGDALAAFDIAVSTWTGDPLAEVADHEAAQSTITQLTEAYHGALEGRFEALLALGRHADALPGMERLAAENPLREEPRALLMVALYRAGRAAEALEVHRTFRLLLNDELGIDPSPRLDGLLRAVLEQAPTLDAPAVSATPDRSGAAAVATDTAPTSTDLHTQAPAVMPTPHRGKTVVGRESETERLAGHLDALVGSGAGSLVLLAGESGIGKTTLLEHAETQARRRGLRVHAGRSPAAGGAPAFWPWTQVLESIASSLDDDALLTATAGPAAPVAQLAPSIAARVGRHAPITGDSAQGLRFIVYEAVSTFLGQASNGAAMVITLDDIQWADLPSLELLSYLTPTLGARPMMLVGAYRNLPADSTEALAATLATVSRDDAADEILLAGLPHEAVAELADDVIADGVEGDAAARERLVNVLHERTGGNPFFVRQLARLLLDAHSPTSAAVEATAELVPPGVGHVIAQRISGLSHQTQEFLIAAAVVGREFHVWLAAAAAEMSTEDALDSFDEAGRHGLVESGPEDGGPSRFVHALVHEVLLGSAPAGRVARLHARVADRLKDASSTAPAALAEHLWAARDIIGAAGVPAQMVAAEAAAGLFSYAQAETYLRRALQMLRTSSAPDPHTELVVLLSLFRVIAIDRGWGDEDARRVVDQATALTETGSLQDDTARLWWSLFFSLLDRDDHDGYVEVSRTLSRTLAAFETNNGPSPASNGCHDGDLETGPGHAARAAVHVMAIFERLAGDDEAGAQQQLRQARRHVDAAPAAELAAYDEHLHVMLLLIEAYWAALVGDLEANRSAAAAAVALADADGRPFPRAIARTLAIAGLPYLDDPMAENAVERISAAAQFANRFGFGWLALSSAAFHAWADALSGGDAHEAARSIEQFLTDLAAANRHGNDAITYLQLADVKLKLGRLEEAKTALRHAIERPGPYRSMVTRIYERRLAELGG
ncbi:MAG TPA: BTAD domain-containing putative transcriptional regulator [Dermatophilaceae bacterium]|nr:BTAD domain-containing putative transcriptional regulator [Dermatophilaceae bacterium]